jgi:hypothetical protein
LLFAVTALDATQWQLPTTVMIKRLRVKARIALRLCGAAIFVSHAQRLLGPDRIFHCSPSRNDRLALVLVQGSGKSTLALTELPSAQHRPEYMVPKCRADAIVSGRKSVMALMMLEQW